MGFVKKFISDGTPGYIKRHDSYKDENGKGFFERMLEVFSEVVEEDTVIWLDGFEAKILDLRLTELKYLPYTELVQSLNRNFTKTETARRKLVQYMSYIFNIKGTEESIASIVGARGFKLTDLVPHIQAEAIYDQSITYDSGSRYDQGCGQCLEITLYMEKNYEGSITLTDLDILRKLIDIVKPIDVEVRDIIVDGESVYGSITSIFLDTEPTSSIEDPQGDLYYTEDDPLSLITLSLSDTGDLVISGPGALNYSMDENGSLIYTF